MNLQPVDRARQLAGVTAYALRKAIREGKIQVLKWGNRQLVDVDTVREVLSEREPMEGYCSTAQLSEGAGQPERMKRKRCAAWIFRSF